MSGTLDTIGSPPPRHPFDSRRQALIAVATELALGSDRPALVVRDYGTGCVCLGVAGPVDRATAQRLERLLRELRVRASRELVITLAGLGPWHPHLARALAHARIQYLVHGAHVELHDLPPALAAELGPTAATTFLVEDAAPVDPPDGHGRPARRPRPGSAPPSGA